MGFRAWRSKRFAGRPTDEWISSTTPARWTRSGRRGARHYFGGDEIATTAVAARKNSPRHRRAKIGGAAAAAVAHVDGRARHRRANAAHVSARGSQYQHAALCMCVCVCVESGILLFVLASAVAKRYDLRQLG